MTAFLSRTPVLWTLFALMMLIGLGFGLFRDAAGGRLLDMVITGAGSRALIDGLTEPQRTAHFWITVLHDTAYPLAYGGFLAGMALRFLGRFGKLAAFPAFATIVVDLTENTVQALALSGAADALDAKDWLTPLKYGLFMVAAAIALIALAVAIVERIRKQRA